MALVVPGIYLDSTGETASEGEGITQTYYASLESGPEESRQYRFYAFWEKEDPSWKSLDAIEDYLRTEAERLSQSIVCNTQ